MNEEEKCKAKKCKNKDKKKKQSRITMREMKYEK